MKSLLESGPKHCVGSPPSARSVLMRSDYRSIDDGADFIVFELQLPEEELPDAALGPVREAVVDRFPRPKSLRQIAPRNAGSRPIEDRVDEKSIANLGARPLPPLRQQCLEPGPLLIVQCMSVHRKLGSHSRSGHKLSAEIRDSP
jgi:hypothetical protein